MFSFVKLSDCFCKRIGKKDFARMSVLPAMVTLISIPVLSQTIKTVNPRLFQKIAKEDSTIKYQVIKNGRVLKTDTATVNNITVPQNEKLVLQTGAKILSNKKDNGNMVTVPASSQFAKTELKFIPEVNVASVGPAGEKISYQIAFTENKKFRYVDSLKKFSGKLEFLLVSAASQGEKLAEPENIEVHSDEVITIQPENLSISHLNGPSAEILLAGDRVSDSVKVKIITASNTNGYTTFIGVEPTLQVFTNEQTLQGFGVDKIPVTVRVMGSNSSDSVKVNFSAGKGTITPTSVYLKYNAPAIVYLRSSGMGNCVLSAQSSNMNSNELHLTYKFPSLFLLASLLGGLIGAATKYYFNAGEKKFSMRPIIGGVLIGFIVAVAYYALGINLIGLDFSAEANEFSVLGLSAVGAYFGIRKGATA